MSRPRGSSTTRSLLAILVPSLLVAWSLNAASTAGFGEKQNSSGAASLSAFRDVASVLASPRCLNCHVAGQSPLHGDQCQPQNMNVKRDTDGRGSPAMRCTNCHQSTNSESLHAPPGAPDWRLPAATMPMAWQGLTVGELCRTLKDPSKNGGRTLSSLVEHVKSDKIVNWGWNPGVGRTTPPLSHQEFVDKFSQWAEGGAPCQP